MIRVDPVIPTDYGIKVCYYVFNKFAECGFNRFRVSIVDMYPHVRDRFLENGLKPLYGDKFSPDRFLVSSVSELFGKVKSKFPDIRIEACAEPFLKNVVHCGCVSSFDLDLLGLSCDSDSLGFQRKGCLCYSGKVELLNNKKQCSHGCLYCYWG